MRKTHYNVYWDVTGVDFAVMKMREKIGKRKMRSQPGFFLKQCYVLSR